MNIDYDKELNIAGDKIRHSVWGYILWGMFVLLLLLWAFLCRSCICNKGNAAGNGLNGSYLYNTASASGFSGENNNFNKPRSKSEQISAGRENLTGSALNKAGANTRSSQTNSTTKQSTSADRQINETSSLSFQIESIKPTQKKQTVRRVIAIKSSGGKSGIAGGSGSFYGLKTTASSRTLFIVDISGSMAAQVPTSPDLRRIDILQNELKKSIRDTNRLGGFAIIAFNDKVKIFPGKKICRYNQPRQIKKAIKFIDELTPNGGTGFKLAWQESIKIIKKNNIDTIYFLTDGDGDARDGYILDLLENKVSDKVVVNCIAIGNTKHFMEMIAEKRKGKYVTVY